MTLFKAFFLSLTVGVGSCAVSGQPAVKLYAFEQAQLPGTVPARGTAEEGSVQNSSKRGSVTYYIYFTVPPKDSIQPLSLFINGAAYGFQTEVLKTSSASINHPNLPAQTLVLVQPQKNKLVQLRPDTLLKGFLAPKKALKRGMDTMPVLVGYHWKGKTYFVGAQEIKSIEPALNQ